MHEPVLVVDFGTTSTAAALLVDGQLELLQEPATGRLGWPSSVLVDGEEILVGSLATRRKGVRSANYRSEIKRLLSHNQASVIDGRQYSPGELVTAILATLRREAEAVHGGPVTHAVLTVPAAYRTGDRRNEQMISAGEAAGFTAVELLPEPVAAALSTPSGQPFQPGDLVLAYDFGGGTFDSALVHVGSRDHEVVASSALEDCGGYDIDERVAAHLCALHEDIEKLYNATNRGRLEVMDAAQALKHQLSDRPDGAEEIKSLGVEVLLTREQFDALVGDLVDRTVECCRALLDSSGYAAEHLNGVFITGGSSRMPLVATALEAAFGSAPRTARDPELAVVRGAAAWASRGESRSCMPLDYVADEEPLRWDFPGGVGTLLDWTVEEGAGFSAGDELARVRLPNGTLVRLRAEHSSVLRARHARPGDRVESGHWLATTERRGFPHWATKQFYVSAKVRLCVATSDGVLFVAVRHGCWAFDMMTGTCLWQNSFAYESRTVQTMEVSDGVVKITYGYKYSSNVESVSLNAATGGRR
ncbi:Hsp70 family protein [Streptomyces sp. NPDC056704]|uniref:Hsp70 family protein n=1 Tax=Streptomyces sp. NPDC056704 TaxID=3345917 RepID=UPI0036AA9E03